MGRVGVLAIQGDYEKHILALAGCGADAVPVRTPEALAQVDRLILPGGESTTVGLLLQRYGLGSAIKERAASGMPVWGTCMGMILMAKEILDRDQYSLALMDIAVRRNAFGAQVASFEDAVEFEGFESPVTGVFIRAPIIERYGNGVEPLATYDGQLVAARQGNLLATAFHPELTGDRRLHELFLNLGT